MSLADFCPTVLQRTPAWAVAPYIISDVAALLPPLECATSSRAVPIPATPLPHVSAIPRTAPAVRREVAGGMAHAAPVEEWPTVSAVPPVANHTAEGN